MPRPKNFFKARYRVHFRRSYAPRAGRHHIGTPLFNYFLCDVAPGSKPSQGELYLGKICVRIECATPFDDPTSETLWKTAPKRAELAKSGSGNNAQTAGNQEFSWNIQGQLRACFQSFLDRFCTPEWDTMSREDLRWVFAMKFPL